MANVHPYGNSMDEKAIEEINQDILLNFYRNYWQLKPFKIYLSGNISEVEIDLIEQYFGGLTMGQSLENKPLYRYFFNPRKNSID